MEPRCHSGGTLVEPWWNRGRTLVESSPRVRVRPRPVQITLVPEPGSGVLFLLADRRECALLPAALRVAPAKTLRSAFRFARRPRRKSRLCSTLARARPLCALKPFRAPAETALLQRESGLGQPLKPMKPPMKPPLRPRAPGPLLQGGRCGAGPGLRRRLQGVGGGARRCGAPGAAAPLTPALAVACAKAVRGDANWTAYFVMLCCIAFNDAPRHGGGRNAVGTAPLASRPGDPIRSYPIRSVPCCRNCTAHEPMYRSAVDWTAALGRGALNAESVPASDETAFRVVA